MRTSRLVTIMRRLRVYISVAKKAICLATVIAIATSSTIRVNSVFSTFTIFDSEACRIAEEFQ